MQTFVYDVLLRWHEGGSICLPTVRAMSPEEAEAKSLALYTSKSRKNAREIENGGSYNIDAVAVPPSEANRWLARN